MIAFAALILAKAPLAQAPLSQATPATTPEKPVLDRYYQCLVDRVLDLEQSRERADLVARAVVHRCRPLFVDAARMLRTEKADAAHDSGLDPADAAGFEDRFRAYSIDYALALVVGKRARDYD